MPEFTGYLQVLPQTEEEEFEGRAKALSKVIMDEVKTESWIEMVKGHYKKLESPEHVERLKKRAREISIKRDKIVEKLYEVVGSISFHYDAEVRNMNYDTNEIEIELDDIRYIISIRSKEGLEKL